ncbi:MAG: GNAT family N-acetyltransferase [Actinobacteria bacterium]|nr:GNAT family N-acetyltransferase [Actinomycetota bacterium]
MAFRVRTVRDLEEFRVALGSIGHYFGWVPTDDDATRFSSLLPFERMHAVLDDGRIVAGAGAFPFQLTVPGGKLSCAGITVVGVLPSHRRRGLLSRMMNAQLADVRERGEPIAALWASEETIYGRYGYGLASLGLHIDAERGSVAIRGERTTTTRLVDDDEALRSFPRVYRPVSRTRPGMIVRTADWWRTKQLDDAPERRRGAGPLVRALFERDGKPVGYALYRLAQSGSSPEDWKKTIRVVEAFGVDDAATRDVWRFLLEIDWVDRIEAYHLPLDHPLPLLVDRVNKLHLKVWDALWVRVVDVPRALAGRSYAGRGRVTLEVTSDGHFPENVGSWTIEDGSVRRARRRPDVRVPVEALGSAFLGGIPFAELEAAGHAEEAARGGIARADALFGAPAPWCPEIF